MKGGKSRLQRVKVLASGKFKFVKNLTRSRSKSVRAKTSTKRRSVRRMARRKKHRSRKMTIPMAPLIGLGVGMTSGPLGSAVDHALAGNFSDAMATLAHNYLGLHSNTFDARRLQNGLVPLVIGGLVHKFVGGSPLNINRMLASAGVPFIRI